MNNNNNNNNNNDVINDVDKYGSTYFISLYAVILSRLVYFDDNDFNEIKIIIHSENRGRKTNTYIIDWNIDTEEMKVHLKKLKKKHFSY